MTPTSDPRSLSFKERVTGHIVFQNINDMYERNQDGTGWARFTLNFEMHIDDVRAFWRGDHVGHLAGSVDCPALGGTLDVCDGRFRLMLPGAGSARHRHMRYTVEFKDKWDRTLTLDGYKDIGTGNFGPWEETTTLLARLYVGSLGELEEAEKWPSDAIAAGTQKIRFIDFLRQFFTYRGSRSVLLPRRLGTQTAFIWGFLRWMWRVYGLGSGPRVRQPVE